MIAFMFLSCGINNDSYSYGNEIIKDLISENYCDFGNKIKIISDELDRYSVFIDIETDSEKGKQIKSIDTYNKYINIKNREIFPRLKILYFIF